MDLQEQLLAGNKYLYIEKIDSDTIFRMTFRNIGQVQLFLSSDPVRNDRIFTEYKSITAETEFAGPELSQAISYCIGGYEENYDYFLKFAHQLEKINMQYTKVNRPEKSFVGHRPNVPAYIAGAPKTMYRAKRAVEKKVVNVFMNVTYPASTIETQIQHRGIIALNLIQILEMNNYIVNFRLFEISKVKREMFICEVGLKNPGEKMDPRKCYYPMCGKSFVRRVLARIKESMPFNERWGFSYGSVLVESKVRQYMNVGENDIYIGSPDDMNIKGENIFDDTDAVLEKLGLKGKIFVPDYKREAMAEAIEE